MNLPAISYWTMSMNASPVQCTGITWSGLIAFEATTVSRMYSSLCGARWRLACPKGPYDLIFPNLDGQPMSYSNLITRGFHPARKRPGIRRIRFHDLRHYVPSRTM
jgi:hypothetical protein